MLQARGFTVTIGLVVGMIANMLIVQIGMVLYPVPDGVDLSNPDQLTLWMQRLPVAQMGLVFLAHVMQAAVGAFAGGWIYRAKALRTGLMVGAISAAFSALNLTQIGHPEWFWWEIPTCVLLGWGVGRVLQVDVDA